MIIVIYASGSKSVMMRFFSRLDGSPAMNAEASVTILGVGGQCHSLYRASSALGSKQGGRSHGTRG